MKGFPRFFDSAGCRPAARGHDRALYISTGDRLQKALAALLLPAPGIRAEAGTPPRADNINNADNARRQRSQTTLADNAALCENSLSVFPLSLSLFLFSSCFAYSS